ncbi:hypothetical protein JQX13_50635 [Archangium violaceum]|uniref:hypothetical protein n=1 Tax=Archangium violaceum TaxID=83451 RepID=UPI00193C136E|nr:hypothetical protein [Archangium violaceum]QRK08120.1 hypothetical protein JQX13_50635 [Archangium violaceum]
MSTCVAVRWLLALLFLLPVVARAGEGMRWDVPSRGAERSHGELRLVQEPVVDSPRLLPDVVRVPPPVHPLGQRLLVEGVAGVGTGLAGALVGVGVFMLGRGIQLLVPGDGLTVLPFALAGMAIGFPLGVWWGGELMMGNGSLLATLGGYAVGGLAAAGLWALSEPASQPLSSVLKGVAIPLPVVGAFLGYEVSSGLRKKARGLEVQPAVVVSTERQALVLAGRF